MPPRFPSFSGYDPQGMLAAANLPYPIRRRPQNPRFPLVGLQTNAAQQILGPDYLSGMPLWDQQNQQPERPTKAPYELGVGPTYGTDVQRDPQGNVIRDPNGNPVAQGQPVRSDYGDPNTPPRTEEEYWIQRWQMELKEAQNERAERQYQFDAQREDRRLGNLVNTFGGFGSATPTGGRGGVFSNGATQVSDLGAAQSFADQLQAQGNTLARVDVDPQTGRGRIAGTNINFEAFGPSGIAKAPAGGPGGAGPHAATNAANRFYESTIGNPEGEAAFAELEKYILENSPRASMLARGEDAGVHMTPAERSYLRAKLHRRRRGA